jgi:hypothetical protein
MRGALREDTMAATFREDGPPGATLTPEPPLPLPVFMATFVEPLADPGDIPARVSETEAMAHLMPVAGFSWSAKAIAWRAGRTC